MAARAKSGPIRDTAKRKLTRCSMRLFVAGNEPNSALARASLAEICATYLGHDCEIEIVNVLKDFRPALAESILVTPALLVNRAGSKTVILGNLSDTEKVLAALQLGSEKS